MGACPHGGNPHPQKGRDPAKSQALGLFSALYAPLWRQTTPRRSTRGCGGLPPRGKKALPVKRPDSARAMLWGFLVPFTPPLAPSDARVAQRGGRGGNPHHEGAWGGTPHLGNAITTRGSGVAAIGRDLANARGALAFSPPTRGTRSATSARRTCGGQAPHGEGVPCDRAKARDVLRRASDASRAQ